jgi:hypothetical protein
VFLRFNPDAYLDLLGIKHTSCFIQNKSWYWKDNTGWLEWKNDEADTASYLLEFEYTWKNVGSYSLLLIKTVKLIITSIH